MDDYIKAQEVADILGIHKNTVYNWIYQTKNNKGKDLPKGLVIKINSRIRFNKKILEEWIKSNCIMENK